MSAGRQLWPGPRLGKLELVRNLLALLIAFGALSACRAQTPAGAAPPLHSMKSVEGFRERVGAASRSPDQLLALGHAYRRLGERAPSPDERRLAFAFALQAYEQAQRLTPNEAEGHFAAAELLLSQGERERARERFQLALALRPDRVGVRERLAEIEGEPRRPASEKIREKMRASLVPADRGL